MVEERLAHLNIEISQARARSVDLINHYTKSKIKYFLIPHLEYNCKIHYKISYTGIESVDKCKDKIQQELHDRRQKDQIIGQTSFGAHRSDIAIYNVTKNNNSLQQSSTGEQKINFVIYHTGSSVCPTRSLW